MKLNKIIGFIGAGNIAEALIRGLITKKILKPSMIIASDIKKDRMEYMKDAYNILTTNDNLKVLSESNVIILAIKPQDIKVVLQEISKGKNEGLIISVIAGIPLKFLAKHLKEPLRIIRVMPNTPALVGAGITAVSPGESTTKSDIEVCHKIFTAVGEVVEVKEALMDAVTGLSGSGPAYVFDIVEAMTDGGVKMGLPRNIAYLLTLHTVLGASKLLLETGKHPAMLKDMVASPGGTTIFGLHALKKGGVSAALIGAVEQATKRSKELGSENLEKI
ncbi:MAG: pyrroline-5-carboxylate reductase [Thermodesulfobacteriota bacterium]|nr:pyrroline-5-carboxylate reductase [Thermodesulfobacteriota bacterium]